MQDPLIGPPTLLLIVSSLTLAWRRPLAACLCLALASAPLTAAADISANDKAVAEALFDRGLELMRAGRDQEACEVLERSQAVEPGVGTMLYLAECYEKVGRTASAWAMYREAASAAQAQGQSDRARVGALRADHLGPSLSKLIVNVAANMRVPGLVITRNGSVVPSAAYGIALPVDPGVQQLTAAAPGYESWTHSMELPSNGARVSVEVPALAALPASPAPEPTAQNAPTTTPVAVSPASAALSTPVESPAPRHTFHKPLAFALGGAGLVAIAVGSYFGVKAIDDNSEAKKLCPNDVCVNQQGKDYDAAAHRAATAANVLVIGGLALASAGVVIFLTRPSEDDDRLQVGLSTSPGMAQLSLRGGF